MWRGAFFIASSRGSHPGLGGAFFFALAFAFGLGPKFLSNGPPALCSCLLTRPSARKRSCSGNPLSGSPRQASTCGLRRVAPCVTPMSLTAEAQPLVQASKALLVIGDKTAELVVGSLNWSTSLNANSECGLRLAVASDAPIVTDFVRDFEAVFVGAALLDEFKSAASKGTAASSSARQSVSTLTV